MNGYGEFLATKQPRAEAAGFEPGALPDGLFDFQSALVRWAVRRGRAAVFADTGLGKTRIQVAWAVQQTGARLIVAPLAVAEQTIAEAARIGVDVCWAAEQPQFLTEPSAVIWITNYEKLHRFDPRLWSNLGELVADPFAGIGTTGYVALQQGRRFIGVELKPEYFAQAVRNLRSARNQGSLFEGMD